MSAETPVSDMTPDHYDQWYDAVTAARGLGVSIRELREAGWTIEPPPEPRYQTVATSGGAHTVVDTRTGGGSVAAFYSTPAWMNDARHPDAESAAQAEADRLNGGDA